MNIGVFLLIEPFATTSSIILYNLLQVLGWAAAGGLVGALSRRKWVKYRTPWSILVITAGGGLIMFATHLGLPYWLKEAVSAETISAMNNPTGPLFSLLMVIIVGTTVYSIRESLDLPVAPKKSLWAARRRQKADGPGRPQFSNFFKRVRAGAGERRNGLAEDQVGGESTLARRPVRVPYSELPEWEPPKDESDLIMLEID